MTSLEFIVDGDTFKVSADGRWICLWTGECWHANPAQAWSQQVQQAAKSTLAE